VSVAYKGHITCTVVQQPRQLYAYALVMHRYVRYEDRSLEWNIQTNLWM